MALKKTVSILCLLASTAMASTAPQITYVGAIPNTAGGTSGVGFKGNTLYWGWTAPSAGNAVIDYIQNFNPANAASYTYSSVTDTPANNGVGQLASYNGTLYALMNPTAASSASTLYQVVGSGIGAETSVTVVTRPGARAFANNATNMAFDSNGTLYVESSPLDLIGNTRIYKFQSTISTAAPTSTDPTPYTVIAAQPTTNTLFAETFDSGIVKFDADITRGPTTFIPTGSLPQSGVSGLTFDSQGNFYVLSSGDGFFTSDIYVFDKNGNALTQYIGGTDQRFGYATISPDGNYLIVSDSTNGILVFRLYGGMDGVVLEEVQKSHLSSAEVQLITNLFMAGNRGQFINSLSVGTVRATVDQFMHQSMEMMDKKDKMPSSVRTSNLVIREAVRAALAAKQGVRTNLGGFQSFTPSQKQYFTHLSQQLPFLQFQSVHSMVDPIALQNVNNGPVFMATPFEQSKMTLKPVFLSNEKSHIWIQPYGGLNRLKSYDQVTGLSFKTAGTAFGVGHYVSENIIMGVLTGGSISSYSQDFSNGTGDIDAGYLGIYGGYEKSEGGLNVDGSVTYGQSRYTSERNITALGLTAKGSHRGWDGSGRVRVGYKVYSGNSSVDPFVELGYRYSYEGSYQENNAGAFNLSVPSSTGKAVDIEIGARFEHTMLVNEVLVKPLIGISALRENPIDKKTNANLGFTDTGNLFSVPISNEIKTYATATIGCVAMFTNNVTLSALATGKARKHETGAELVLKASYAF